MKLFGRREQPPAAALAGLDDGERVVSWADTASGDVVVATSLGVWWPFPDALGGRRRIGWQHVDKAVWQQDNVLSVTEAVVEDGEILLDRPAVHAKLTVPRDLPPVIRKRVEQNIVRSELVSVPGGAVRFVGRRLPGQDGTVWWARFEPGTPDTGRTRAAVRARLEVLRTEATASGR